MEEENTNKRKIVIPMALGIAVLTILVLGATYAYFTVGTSNNFGSKTITATTPEVGSVTLSSGESLSLNMTSELMMEENIGTYYATTTGVPSTTLTEVDIATATVTGSGNFNCSYDLTITPSATNSLYTAFTGMTGHAAGQIVLKVGSHTYDFNTTDFSSSITIQETFSNVTSSASKSIKASLMFNNTDFDQNALQGKDITLTFTTSNFSCTAIEAPKMPSIGNFVTLDNQSGIYYRVLYNETETTYMLLRMNNDLERVTYNTTENKFVTFENGSKHQKYAGSTLDTYMNETYYNTLSENIKNAIVDKNIDEGAYSMNFGTPSGEYYMKGTYYNNEETYWIGYVTKVNVGTRHVYALDIEDILKYLGKDNLSMTNINEMFFNASSNMTSIQYVWLRSADGNSFDCVWYVFNEDGMLNDGPYVTNTYKAFPAFLIDLSAVDFEEIDASTITPATLGNS